VPKPISETARTQTLIRSVIRTGTLQPLKKVSGRERAALRKRAERSELSAVKPSTVKRNITECIRLAMDGDPTGILDPDRIPLHKLALKIVSELSGEEIESWKQHRVLEMIWDRTEGRVPDRLEHEVNVRGVIALPVVTSSALDWAADAVKVLGSARKEDALEVRALPSPKDDA